MGSIHTPPHAKHGGNYSHITQVSGPRSQSTGTLGDVRGSHPQPFLGPQPAKGELESSLSLQSCMLSLGLDCPQFTRLTCSSHTLSSIFLSLCLAHRLPTVTPSIPLLFHQHPYPKTPMSTQNPEAENSVSRASRRRRRPVSHSTLRGGHVVMGKGRVGSSAGLKQEQGQMTANLLFRTTYAKYSQERQTEHPPMMHWGKQ